MADVEALEERPQKRARLEGPAAHPADSESLAVSPAPQGAIAPVSSRVDTEVEKETRAGITEYVSRDNLGFTGVLKQRYTDFLVNEIGLDGNVLHLRSTGEKGGEKIAQIEDDKVKKDNVPGGATNGADNKQVVDYKEEAPKKANGDAQVKTATEETEKPATATEISEEQLKTLHSIFGEDTTSAIISLYKKIAKHPDRKARDFDPVMSAPITDKEQRTQAHINLRTIFPGTFESVMEQDQSIRIRPLPPQDARRQKGNFKNAGGADGGKRGGGDKERRRGKVGWEELGGEYLHFTLYKENKDTMEVIGFLGSRLKSGAKPFGFAGTKDRRACTAQRVSVKRQTVRDMQRLNEQLRQAQMGDYEYMRHELSLGDLRGNEFTITLRDAHFQNEGGMDNAQRLKLANDVLSKAVEDFANKGFINYFGLQRFGSFAASTDAVGKKLLQDNLEGAVNDLLTYSDAALEAYDKPDANPALLVSQDDRARAKGLHIWATTHNADQALRILPKKFTAESNIVRHLGSKNKGTGSRDRRTDYQGALNTLPRNLRLMYVHAYQSMVWNTVAGKRWTTFGDKVVEGDLVLVKEHEDKLEDQPKPEEDEVDQHGEVIINPAGADSAFRAEDQFERARALTSSEASSGKYSIFDVVLPLPGYDVEYPANELGKFYEEFMGSEKGGGLDPHNMRRSWREISLSGGYRKLLARPLQKLSYQVREYVKAEEQFVETDLEKLIKERDGAAKEDAVMKDADNAEEGDRKLAVIVKMQLGTSQYATVALRELMKPGGVQNFKPEYMGGR